MKRFTPSCAPTMAMMRYECPDCGNHVCENCAAENGGICPHCFGRLYRIS